MPGVRVFVAVDIPEPHASQLATLGRELNMQTAVNAVKADHMHLTLKFLGELAEAQVRAVADGLEACRGLESFKVRLRGVGGFPSAWRPRVVWVGAHSSRLVELKKRVEQGIQQAGFHPERVEDFKAHVTLARVKGDHEKAGKFVREHAEDTFGNFEARSVLLKQSILTPSGSEYQIIRKVDL